MSDLSPIVILVSPQMGENIGATARVMLNFGLTRLRLVAPRDGWPNSKAVDMAVGAYTVLENAQVYDTLAEALNGVHRVYAASARPRDLVKHVYSPEAFAQEARNAQNASEQCAIMFGPERTGLTNEDISYAHAIVTIPVNPDFPSINLAQSVGVLCHMLSCYEAEAVDFRTGRSPLADQRTVAAFLEQLEELLEEKQFFKVPEKKPGMLCNIHNIFTRLPLTEQEIRTLHGIMRALSEPVRGDN